MTVENMRREIAHVYDTRSWDRKVDEMYDDQVIAIYYKFQKEGKLNKVLRKEKPQPKTIPINIEQLDIFSLINKGENV